MPKKSQRVKGEVRAGFGRHVWVTPKSGRPTARPFGLRKKKRKK